MISIKRTLLNAAQQCFRTHCFVIGQNAKAGDTTIHLNRHQLVPTVVFLVQILTLSDSGVTTVKEIRNQAAPAALSSAAIGTAASPAGGDDNAVTPAAIAVAKSEAL